MGVRAHHQSHTDSKGSGLKGPTVRPIVRQPLSSLRQSIDPPKRASVDFTMKSRIMLGFF